MTEEKEERKRAVALKYDALKDRAPKVAAKGQGEIAEKIIALAKEHGIPIREDIDLVNILSKFDIGQEIPDELYQVIAEILVFVYEQNRAMGRNG